MDRTENIRRGLLWASGTNKKEALAAAIGAPRTRLSSFLSEKGDLTADQLDAAEDWLKENAYWIDSASKPTSIDRLIAEADESLPEALTLAQVANLLKTTQEMDPDLLPWLCTGLFAGLRTAELDRVTADHFKGARLHLDPSVTKLRDRRVLDLLPVLQEWLQAYPPQGRLRQPAHYKRWTAIRKAAGVDPWPDNAIRHSFSTYHLAAFQDPAKTAHYTRHSNQNTLHRHYIDLATHDDGLKYFNLTPKALKKWKTEN